MINSYTIDSRPNPLIDYLNSFKERILRRRNDIIDNAIVEHLKNNDKCSLSDLIINIEVNKNLEIFCCKNCNKDIIKMKRWN